MIDKETLERLLLVENKSYEEIGRQFDCTGANIKRQVKLLGIRVPKRRSINPTEHYNKGKRTVGEKCCLSCGKELKESAKKYCGTSCQHEYKNRIKIEKWSKGEIDGTVAFTTSRVIRTYLLKKHEYKCQECGWSKVNEYTKKIPLQVHHIDGNSCNNVESNLQILCPNCHSLTPNWGNRNKNAPKGKSDYYTTKKSRISIE